MKKSIKMLVVASILVLAMAVSAFAANTAVEVTYEGEDAGIHKITGSVEDELGIKQFTLIFSFDTSVVLPYDAIEETTFDITELGLPLGPNAYQDEYAMGVVEEAKLGITPSVWEVDPDTGRTAVRIGVATTNARNLVKSGAVMSFEFMLAEGKTIDDAKFALEGVDTKFDYMVAAGFHAYGGVVAVDKDNVFGTLADETVTYEGFFGVAEGGEDEPETPDATVEIGGGVAGTEQEVNGIKFSTTFTLAENVTADEIGYLVSSSNNVASAEDVTCENTEDLVLKTSKTEFVATLEAFLYASDPEALAGNEDVEVYVRPYIVVNGAPIYGATQTTTVGAVLEANN